MDNISAKLDELEELRDKLEELKAWQESEKNSLLTPELRAKFFKIDTEFEEKSNDLNGEISALDQEIRFNVTEHGQTVKGEHLMAVFCKGHVYWDDKMLLGYSAAHPEIKEFRKVGDPIITIRAIQNGFSRRHHR